MDGEIVAAGIKPPGERRQRLALDVDDGAALVPVAGNGAFGRARHVEQDRHGQIALFGAVLEPDPVVALAGGQKVHARADRPVGVQFVAIAVARGQDARGSERLELALDGADAPDGLIPEFKLLDITQKNFDFFTRFMRHHQSTRGYL